MKIQNIATDYEIEQIFNKSERLREKIVLSSKVPYFLFDWEIMNIVNATSEAKKSNLILLLSSTGVTLRELLALRKCDFDEVSNTLRINHLNVRNQKQCSYLISRSIRLQKEIIDRINKEITLSVNIEDFLWRVSDETVRNWICDTVRVLRRYGFRSSDKVSTSTFRHSFAINSLLKGATEEEIFHTLGFKNPRSLNKYRSAAKKIRSLPDYSELCFLTER